MHINHVQYVFMFIYKCDLKILGMEKGVISYLKK